MGYQKALAEVQNQADAIMSMGGRMDPRAATWRCASCCARTSSSGVLAWAHTRGRTPTTQCR